jgi:hypothetical protein
MIRRSHYILNLVYSLLTSSTFMDRWKISILFDGWGGSQVEKVLIRAQHFPSNLYPYPDHNHHQQPMPTHAHPQHDMRPPMPPMLFKLRPCIQKLCNVYAYTKSWLDRTNKRSLASARSASWLAYSLHPRSLTPIWSWMQGYTKPMPTDAYPKSMGMGEHGHGHGYGHPM